MTSTTHSKITYVWLLLVAMTVLSWGLGEGFLTDADTESHWSGLALMLIAFFKVRLVILHFMEISTAIVPLRLIFEAWVILACAGVLLLYFKPF